jgi:hypothetical protein
MYIENSFDKISIMKNKEYLKKKLKKESKKDDRIVSTCKNLKK